MEVTGLLQFNRQLLDAEHADPWTCPRSPFLGSNH